MNLLSVFVVAIFVVSLGYWGFIKFQGRSIKQTTGIPLTPQQLARRRASAKIHRSAQNKVAQEGDKTDNDRKRRNTSWNTLAVSALAFLLVILVIFMTPARKEGPTEDKLGSISLKSTTKTTKYNGSADTLAVALVEAVMAVEDSSGLMSFPFSPDKVDYFNLGDTLEDEEGTDAANIAWAKIRDRIPKRQRNDKSLSYHWQRNSIIYVTAEDIKNGLSVEQIIVRWPRVIKGWSTEKRVDDLAGWTSATEYSDSLRVAFLRTYTGKVYGTSALTAKDLITPNMLREGPIDWTAVLLAIFWSVVAYVALRLYMQSRAQKWARLQIGPTLSALFVALVSTWLIGLSLIAKLDWPDVPTHASNVYVASALYFIMIYGASKTKFLEVSTSK